MFYAGLGPLSGSLNESQTMQAIEIEAHFVIEAIVIESSNHTGIEVKMNIKERAGNYLCGLIK